MPPQRITPTRTTVVKVPVVVVPVVDVTVVVVPDVVVVVDAVVEVAVVVVVRVEVVSREPSRTQNSCTLDHDVVALHTRSLSVPQVVPCHLWFMRWCSRRNFGFQPFG